MRGVSFALAAFLLTACSSSGDGASNTGGKSGSGGGPAGGGGTTAGGGSGGTSGASGGSSGVGGSSGSGASGGMAGAGGSGGSAGAGTTYTGCVTPWTSSDPWPTASNVGLPPGTTLTPIDSDTHTTADGQVFDGVQLNGRLYVDHQNVVIKNSKLVGDVYYAVYTTINDAHLTIEDCDVTGGLLLTDHTVARRNYLHAGDGHDRDDGFIFAASHVVLEHNRIDGLIGGDGAHVDGIQVMGGDDIVICHNWVDPSSPPVSNGGVNAAVFFGPDFGDITNVVVSHNMLLGGGSWYTLRIDCKQSIDVEGNRFDKDFLGTPVLVSGDPITTWADNAYDDGTPIPQP